MGKTRDVPHQYKVAIDRHTLNLMDSARLLWPIVRELGESFECEDEENSKFTVRIERLTEGKSSALIASRARVAKLEKAIKWVIDTRDWDAAGHPGDVCAMSNLQSVVEGLV